MDLQLSIPLYAVCERSLHYAAQDPFGVEVVATFTHESGLRLRVEGFYDGDDTYRVRSMPCVVGDWSYRIMVDDRLAARGAFHCAPSDGRGPLRRHPAHPEHLIFSNGEPFYMLGNTAYNALVAYRQAPDAFREFLDYYHARRFNWVRFFLHQTTWPTLGGLVWPWGGTPEAPDWATYSLPTFREAEGVIVELASRGMIASVILLHSVDEPIHALGNRRVAEMRRFIRCAVARLGANWNVVWNLASEWQRGEVFSYEEMDELGEALRAADPCGRLISCHHYGRFEFHDKSWTSMSSMQHRGLPHEVHRHVLQNKGFGKPVLNEEYGYEGDNHQPPNDPDNVRHDHWAIATAGGYGTYGDKTKGPKVAVYFSSVLQDAVGTIAPDALRHLHRFMAGTDYLHMRPADEFLSGCSPDEVFCLAAPGREFVVYMVRGQEVVLNLTHARGMLRVTWLNPRTGEEMAGAPVRVAQSVDEGDCATEGELGWQHLRQRHLVHFTPPDEEHDWVLHLRLEATGA